MRNYMKQILSLLVITFTLILVACSDNDTNTSKPNNGGDNTNEQQNTSHEKGDDNSNSGTESEKLAIYSDHLITFPTIQDIVNIFSKLQFTYTDVTTPGEKDNDNVYTYEWVGEEELFGETVDKIHIHIKIDREYENYENSGDLWLNKEGNIVQVITHGDSVYNIEEYDDESIVENVALSYTLEILYPFYYFDMDVRKYLNVEYIEVTDHSTGSEQLFGETVETHTIDIKALDDDFYMSEKETTVAYFKDLEVALSAVTNTGEMEYFDLEIIDYEFR